MTVCRICGGLLEPVLDLREQYVATHLQGEVFDDKKYPLCMARCQACGVCQLTHTVPWQQMFNHYWYRSAVNPAMVDALADLAEESVAVAGITPGDTVLDIGCNDWTLLDKIPKGVIKYGIDPSDVSRERMPDDCSLIPIFFPEGNLSITPKANLITAVACFYDAPDPLLFLKAVRDLLDYDGVLVLQLSYLPLMLHQVAFDNICHEHLFYLCLQDIVWMADQVGMKVFRASLNDVNGGSMRVYISREYEEESSVGEILAKETSLQSALDGFRDRVLDRCMKAVERLAEWKSQDKLVHLSGASTKGQVFLQYTKIGTELVDAVEERNPRKVGKKTLTGIPIIHDQHLSPDAKLVLPWHFLPGIVERESRYLEEGGTLAVALPDWIEVTSSSKDTAVSHFQSLLGLTPTNETSVV